MQLNNLRVSDVQDLRTEASNFDEHATAVRKVTDQMLELVESTSSVWEGEARNKYNSQFQQLRNNMNFIYEMCHEYSTDLIDIAKNYEAAETDNVATAGRLKADVELI